MIDCPMFSFSSPSSPRFRPGRLQNQLLQALHSMEQDSSTRPLQPSCLDSTLWNEPPTRPIASGQYGTEIFHPARRGPSNLPAREVKFADFEN